LQVSRSIGRALAVVLSMAATHGTVHAETLFSFVETTDAGSPARIAPALAPASENPSADIGGSASPGTTSQPSQGDWQTVVIPADDGGASQLPAATRSLARSTAPAAPIPGPRLTGTGHSLTGVASYYWQDQMTATGERFNKRDLTAAHKTLPFGTRVRVTRVDTGSSVVVRINDRGPFTPGRVIDLSERAAEEIGMTGVGLSKVRLEVLGR
jgi:rare lipoprotein A